MNLLTKKPIHKLMTRSMLYVVVLLSACCFLISCTDNKGVGSKTPDPETQVPPELIPTIVNEGVTTSTGGSTEGSSAGHSDNSDYSPGNNDWALPTQEEQDEWDHDVYVTALEKWAEPRLAKWNCQTCKGKLNKDFKFLDRTGDNIRFACKCECGHTHTVTLQGKQ